MHFAGDIHRASPRVIAAPFGIATNQKWRTMFGNLAIKRWSSIRISPRVIAAHLFQMSRRERSEPEPAPPI